MVGFNIVGYFIFAFVTSITPGPNNYLLFAHGRAFGMNDSRKLMLGIFTGFFTMACIAGFGVAEIITQSQTFGLILKIVGSIWLFYLAFVLSKLTSDIKTEKPVKLTFIQAYLMQFINPKAWIMAISGAGAFMPHLGIIPLNVFVLAISFNIIGVPCMFVWIKFGDLISKLIKSEKANRILGYTLFGLMMISIAMIWFE
jgi:threonine/homoserine/homoserine lactone efflux protein